MKTSILLVGAGYIGAALAETLVASGATVTVLRRRPEALPGTRLIQGDLTRPETLRQLPVCSHVVYCAAADGGSEEAYRAVYVEGLHNLVEAITREGQRPHIVYTSSTSVYAESKGGAVDEATGQLQTGGLGGIIAAGEELLRQGPCPASIVRLGGIYGPGRTYFLRRIQQRQEVLWSGDPLYSNRIHRDDAVGILRYILDHKQVQGQIYNGVDCEAAERNEVIRWMAALLGMDANELATTSDRSLVAHRGNKRISSLKIRERGFAFRYPSYREGYRSLLAEVSG